MIQKAMAALKPLFKKHTPAVLAGVGVAVVLAAGGLAAFWIGTQRKPLIASLPAGSNVVPQDALATLTFSTDPSQWQTLRQFGTPETQTRVDEQLAELRDRFLTSHGYDYRRDIQPWIGEEMTVAILTTAPVVPTSSANPGAIAPLPRGAETQQQFVMVLPIANPAVAQNLLADAQDNAQPNTQQSWETRDYKGIEIRETGSGDDAIAAAVLGNQFVVVSPTDSALEQVIDTYKGGTSVANTPGYRQAIGRIAAAEPFARVYVNAPVARELATVNTIQPIPTQGLSPLSANQGLAATLTLEPEGVQIRGIGWLAADSQQRYDVKNTASQLPTLLPDDTLLMVSGGNLQQLWQTYSQQANAEIDPKSLSNPANFRQAIQETTGLDLEQDWLSWMNGEFGIALIPSGGQTNSGSTAGLVLFTKASDRTAAEQTLKQLDDEMGDRYQFKVSNAQVDGESVVKWVSPFASLTVTRGWLSGDVAFMAIGNPTISDGLLKSTSSLEQSTTFRQATATDLKANNGHFFINVDQLINTKSNIPIPNLPQNIQTFAKAIRAIGVTTAIQDERSTRYDIQVLLHKNNNSRPLPVPNASPSP
jgi:hypothetical protein